MGEKNSDLRFVSTTRVNRDGYMTTVRTGRSQQLEGSYAFVRLDAATDSADVVRGDEPDVDGTPVAYIGDSFGKHYYTGRSTDEVPAEVVEELESNDLVLVDGFDGGWESWDGRPEFSTTYADLESVELVETAVPTQNE